ncbi:hypothetical protein [Zavarzinella formosa]|uniref:hypothetical protein n=1 Tax=Zavarzinella formosa TaxID=360055 RepID=UPI0003044394|nr:hypothetical protein [Zavarzinella formosa]
MTRHFKAPQTDGGLLAEPPIADYERLLSVNRERLSRLTGSVGSLTWPEFRASARTELIGQAPPDQPILMAGHQPELFHPGVWAKNFVLAAQAKKLGANAVNLIVDNDTFKTRSLMLPVSSPAPDQVVLETIPFDESVPELPYEEAYPRDWAALESWPDRLRAVTKTWPFEPMVFCIWPRIVTCLKTGVSFTRAFVEARQILERRWGAGTPELPVSQLSGHRSFNIFARHLMVDAERFASVYNSSIADYRFANGIRSRNHPAPELQVTGDLIETAFWTWRADTPARQRVFVRRQADRLDVLAGTEQLIGTFSASADINLREMFEHSGWKLRPRALTLTLFSRLALGDLFIHGIGGGKYDEVTDEIIRRYFNIEPPEYSVVSATIRLPLERFASNARARTDQQRLMRDLEWNPQNFAEARDLNPDLVAAKHETVRREPTAKTERRAWFRELSHITQRLRPATATRTGEAARALDAIGRELDANKKLARRDFSWVFYPEEYLATAYRGLMGV